MKRITKKVKQELKTLINTKGYWSNEVKNYIAEFQYCDTIKLHNMALAYDKYREGELMNV